MRDYSALLIVLLLSALPESQSWASPAVVLVFQSRKPASDVVSAHRRYNVKFDSLMDMDVVIFSRNDDAKKIIGAIQEDGTLTPLSVWSPEPVFGDKYLEFLVDEEDRFPGLLAEDVVVHSIIEQDCLSYGSRQVGGGMGPGNPHGEESEQLYYVDEAKLQGIEMTVRPELEIFW